MLVKKSNFTEYLLKKKHFLKLISGSQPGTRKAREGEDGTEDPRRNQLGQALAAGQPGHRNVRSCS